MIMICGVIPIFAQTPVIEGFVLNGNAQYLHNNHFMLTSDSTGSYGTMWYKKKADLRENFDITAYLNFGSNDEEGADGITFTLQNKCLRAGATGGGLGISGVSPSIIIKFDTFENGWAGDLAEDHLAIIYNGDFNMKSPNVLVSPICILPSCTNIETGQNYKVRILWNASIKTLQVYVQDSLRASHTADIVNNIFSGNPIMYWGFTAATGASTNKQTVQILELPNDNLNGKDTLNLCDGDSLPLSLPGFVSYSWFPNLYISDTSIADPVIYPPTGKHTYFVKYTDTCNTYLIDTFHVIVHPKPIVSISGDTLICYEQTTSLVGTGANSYLWNTGNYDNPHWINPLTTTLYSVTGVNEKGCTDTDSLVVKVKAPIDTGIIMDGSKGWIKAREPQAESFTWLQCIENVLVALQEGREFRVPSNGYYSLLVEKNGCRDTSACLLFQQAPAIRIPNAFSPNGDGRNDEWLIEGIEVYPQSEIRVFNRWGTLVYQSSKGYPVPWNGKSNDQDLPPATYYYSLNFRGSRDGTDHEESGTVTLIR